MSPLNFFSERYTFWKFHIPSNLKQIIVYGTGNLTEFENKEIEVNEVKTIVIEEGITKIDGSIFEQFKQLELFFGRRKRERGNS